MGLQAAMQMTNKDRRERQRTNNQLLTFTLSWFSFIGHFRHRRSPLCSFLILLRHFFCGRTKIARESARPGYAQKEGPSTFVSELRDLTVGEIDSGKGGSLRKIGEG